MVDARTQMATSQMVGENTAGLLRELVAHLRQNRTQLREEWVRRITSAQAGESAPAAWGGCRVEGGREGPSAACGSPVHQPRMARCRALGFPAPHRSPCVVPACLRPDS